MRRELAFYSAALVSAVAATCDPKATCKCFPSEPCWPSHEEWKGFNASVSGRLIETVPLAAPCHDPVYDKATCDDFQDQWTYSPIHMDSSSSIMAPWFANQSCDPFQSEARSCELGNYVRYSVDVRDSDDVVNAINFARNHNIRFVIRNTGHDYLGRSTGAGALSVWTHHLKDIEFIDWHKDGYTGKAAKLGAGVQGFDILYTGHDAGYVILGGECSTVGVSGGYTQGGGHSALSTSFGLSADNTLEFEVVTANGDLVTASRSENSDLFWALSGGGGGNWGVVLSMTVKAHPTDITSGASLTFYNTDGDSKFYAAIESFHKHLPAIVDAGAMVIYFFTNSFFSISPLTAFGKTNQEVQDMLKPFTDGLDSSAINYTATYTQSDSYFDHYDEQFGPLPNGHIQVGIAQYGGRLIPRHVIEANNAGFMKTAREIVEQNVTWIGVATNVAPFGNATSNAVVPAWREALVHATLTTEWDFNAPWEEMKRRQDLMTDKIIPAIEAVTPGSGVYMNEADFRQPNFQEAFFGNKYDTLMSIKKKWDPKNFFFAVDAVGSEVWTVSDNGRMCRT